MGILFRKRVDWDCLKCKYAFREKLQMPCRYCFCGDEFVERDEDLKELI